MDIRQVGNAPVGAAAPQARPATGAAPVPAAAPAAAAGSAKPPAPDQHQLEEAVRQLNKTVASMKTGIEFSIDEETDTRVVKVIDQDTKEVLRQMPTEETLAISKSIDKLQGLLIKHKA
jgi:flagellar protein FlaG